MTDRPSTKAARLIVLHELRRNGHLANYNQSEIARVFDVDRSTILRDLRTLDQADSILNDMRRHWLDYIPPIKSPQ